MNRLDSVDIQLVSLMGQDATQTSEALAKQLNLSSATVRRRLRKLIRSGLLRIIGVVDPSKFELPLAVVISLDVDHDKVDSVMEELVKKPEIRFLSTTTGRFDITAMARFHSTDLFSEFLKTVLGKLEGVRDSESFICLDVKKGRYVVFL